MLEWAKSNILKWTVGIAVLSFVVGPLTQEQLTDYIKETFGLKPSLVLEVCSPLRNATLLVTSTSGAETKTHSAGQYPFLQQARVLIYNNTESPIPESSVFVAPLNVSSNFLLGANFYSDNNITKEEYQVSELENNAFRIKLGDFAQEQVLVMEFVTLLPTSFVVEFAGKTVSKKVVFNAGSCDKKTVPDKVSLPVDFFYKSEFPENPDESLFGKIEDISEPIGPINFEVVLDYDCGQGLQRQIVPMGGPVSYCHMKINQSKD